VLTHPTLDQLHQLGLAGMARAFVELEANPTSPTLSHAEWTPRNTIFADGLRATAAARVAAQTGSDRWLSRGMPKSVDFMSRQCGSALEPRQSGEVVGQVGERDFGGCARLTDGPDDQV
jgi:hypothetical protein